MRPILIIEDDEPSREYLLEMLGLHGFQLLGAENGAIGVQLARKHLPALILCDVMMPELSGHDVLALLRREPATASIPFIFLTSKSDKADVRQGMNLGADDYLIKPCSEAELLQAVNSRLRKDTAVRELYDQKLENLRQGIAQAVPHELLTPLNGILGLTQLLLDQFAQSGEVETRMILAEILLAGQRLHHVIGNYILHAELELVASDPAKVEALCRHRTDAARVIEAAAARKAEHWGRESDLILELPKGAVAIAETYLRTVVEELLDNAFRFSAIGSPVRLSSSTMDSRLNISIRDHGRGMTPQQIANIGAYIQFERRFYEQQGSGLGLWIAKRIVELHGGAFRIYSSAGEGTEVSMSFPTVVQASMAAAVGSWTSA